jgi:hypothetical protein
MRDGINLPYNEIDFENDVGYSASDLETEDVCEFCLLKRFCENDSPETDKDCKLNKMDSGENYSETGWHEFSDYRFNKIGNRWSEKNYELSEMDIYLASE